MPSALTKEQFQEKINSLFPDEKITILKYETASKPITFKCEKCQTEYKIFAGKGLYRKKHCCNNCFYSLGEGEKTKEYKKIALDIIKQKKTLQFLDFGYNEKLLKPTIKVECLKCKQNFEKQLVFFVKQNSDCPYCEAKQHLNTAAYKNMIPQDYTLLEEYQGTDTKVLFRHEECGFIWKTAPHNIRSGCGCPKCAKRRSRGKKKIIDFLTQQKIPFEAEKKFIWSGLKRYDFYLPSYNLVIEYNGIQHYQEINFFGKSLAENQLNDKQKKEMALQNNLDFFEISYQDFDKIEEILAQRLSVMSVAEQGINPQTESIPLG